nr:ribosomal RNA processing protein 36 homolog [Ipomoea trifida]
MFALARHRRDQIHLGQEKATRMIISERGIELRWLPSRILHVMQIEHENFFLTSVFASFCILNGQEKATRMIISERGIELRWLPSRILHVMQVDAGGGEVDVCGGEVQPISSTVLNPLLRIYHGRDVTFYASDGPSLLVKVSHDEEDCRVTLIQFEIDCINRSLLVESFNLPDTKPNSVVNAVSVLLYKTGLFLKNYLGNRMKKAMEPEVVATSSKIKFEDSDEHDSSSEDVEEEIERELAEVTFEELQKARSDGSEVLYRKPTADTKGGRSNKNRPMEISSKKPVSRFREVVQVPKRIVRDPRFETLCGKLDEEGFKKRYNFLYQKDLPAEKEDLKKQMTRTNDPQVINELKNRIAWIDKQLKSASTRNTEKVILSEHKKKQREAAKQGKQPYYLKKSEIRQRKIIEKYKELKGSGKLEAFIEKKRRKNASKDHRSSSALGLGRPRPSLVLSFGWPRLSSTLVLEHTKADISLRHLARHVPTAASGAQPKLILDQRRP